MESFRYRAFGDYRYFTWTMFFCNSLVPLTLFAQRLRRNTAVLLAVSLLVNVGMWLERFVIIVTSLAHDFDPYVWGSATVYAPTYVEVGISLGSFGLFFMLYLIFLKTLPVLSITEIKEHL
jgi:molybdopterin-containing oxidoreductase family membrane subunit